MKIRTEFVCSECGSVSAKWFGKCPSCGAWNSLEEKMPAVSDEPAFARKKNTGVSEAVHTEQKSRSVNEITYDEKDRINTGIGEFDRTLGGGLVQGSVTLLSGEPGVGKSTLLLQVCGCLGSTKKLLYVTGEESPSQIKLRAKRLGVACENILIYAETDISEIIAEADITEPDIIVIDSIQTMLDPDSSSASGSVTQVRSATTRLIRLAKSRNVSIIIVGHVNKDGGIAGPKVLEHMVDTVLYFEGEKQYSYRMLRAVKNRFGSTNEIGIFEMEAEGLCEVTNPSEYLLSQRAVNVSGNCTLCVMEGTRPILAEIQALITNTAYPVPKRVSNGLDYNRLAMLTAVLEKRLGLRLSNSDIFVNIVGGLRIDDPSGDLAGCLAIISGCRDLLIDEKLIAMGEIGLAGECRAIGSIEQRIRESVRLGFRTILIPKRNFERMSVKCKEFAADADVKIIPVAGISDAITVLKKK